MQNKAKNRTQRLTAPRETPMAVFAPVLRPPELGFWDAVSDPVGAVVVGNASVVEEPIVEDGAKLYPLTWTA